MYVCILKLFLTLQSQDKLIFCLNRSPVKNSMRYGFYFTAAVNARDAFYLFLFVFLCLLFIFLKGTCACILSCFSDSIFLGPKSYVYIFIYMAFYSL